MEPKTTEYKKALHSEVSPLLIGLRNDIKALATEVGELRRERTEAETKTVEVSVTNPVSEVRVLNEPIDPRDDIKNVEIAIDEQTDKLAVSLDNFGSYMKSAGYGLGKLMDTLKSKVFTVKVENPTTEVKVTNLSDIKQPEYPTSVHISNAKPSEAIPVVLTTRDRKRFYEVLTTLAGGVAQSKVDIGEVNANLDELEALNGATLIEAWGDESSVPQNTETTLCSFVVPAGYKVRIKGVDATGDSDAIFTLHTNGTKKAEWRNAWTNRNVVSNIEAHASAGQTVALKVNKIGSGLGSYSGHIHAYVLSL